MSGSDRADRPEKSAMRGVVPVVMSGGAGARLWPLSTELDPKQFHALNSGLTMIQETVLRVDSRAGVVFAPPIVICNRRHTSTVQAQLRAIGVEPSLIVLEPFGRNTAAVAAIAARLVAKHYPGMLTLLMPADHVIVDKEAFLNAIGRGARANEHIITFGIKATAPETGYGYIQRGKALGDGVFAVARFTEKPDSRTAQAYLEEGGYDWNSGIFLFAPEVMLAEFSVHRPDVLDAVDAVLAEARMDGRVVDIADATFVDVPSVSLDLAVMEPTRLAAVVPCEIGWADIGSWNELWRLGPRDGNGNRSQGETAIMDSRDSIVWADTGVTIGVLGLADMIVVAAHGAVLVLPRSRAQEVKRLVEELARRRGPESDLAKDPDRG